MSLSSIRLRRSTELPRIDADGLRRKIQEGGRAGRERVREVILRALDLRGLSDEEAAILLACDEPELVAEMQAAARRVKDAIYGRRLVLFAPLYYSNHCSNDCMYCGFRRQNQRPRRRLTMDEVAAETRVLIEQGHKRLLVIGGEDAGADIDYLTGVIGTVYATRSGRGEIRRVNVEAAPMTVDEFRRLGEARIGTYVCFQETYDREVYARMHHSGPKADFDWRLGVMDRAMEGGIHDVGIGVLFGLNDYRFEVLALLAHARHLETRFGVGPHTISVPRIEPAEGAPAANSPPAQVSDDEFRKLVAILRLAVPYTGIILSTRESAALRGELLSLGVSQMSAGSCTEPGGYTEGDASPAQFSVGDHRSLDQVIGDILRHGYVPSFCTGCYRLGRVGQDFMDLARPGLIRAHCLPNALFTFAEYLEDYAAPATRSLGEKVIAEQLAQEVSEARRPIVEGILARIRGGERDIYL